LDRLANTMRWCKVAGVGPFRRGAHIHSGARRPQIAPGLGLALGSGRSSAATLPAGRLAADKSRLWAACAGDQRTADSQDALALATASKVKKAPTKTP
jgi:hypothetical protein